MGYMNTPEVPVGHGKNILTSLFKKSPLILLGGTFIVFSTGCAFNLKVNDRLIADRNVTVGFCTVEKGQSIVLQSLNVVQQGAEQSQDVWMVSGACSGALPSDTAMTAFSRPELP